MKEIYEIDVENRNLLQPDYILFLKKQLALQLGRCILRISDINAEKFIGKDSIIMDMDIELKRIDEHNNKKIVMYYDIRRKENDKK